MLVSSGAFAMEQLAEALTATAGSNKLPDGLPQTALNLCAEQVLFGAEKLLVLCIVLMGSCAAHWFRFLHNEKLGRHFFSDLRSKLPLMIFELSIWVITRVYHSIGIHFFVKYLGLLEKNFVLDSSISHFT